MKDWKHINFEQRKVISSWISHNYKLKEIADTLGLNPTSISKEVKRNRKEIKNGTEKNFLQKDKQMASCLLELYKIL